MWLQMVEKFKNKYSIDSSRLQGYDYSQNGMYFVTICTKNREECLGSVVDDRMVLSEMGKIADRFWQEIPKHFPFVNLDVYQIMPNHVHGNIEIINDKNNVETQFIASEINQDVMKKDALKCVSTKNNIKPGGITGLKNPSLNLSSLSNVIKWYKGRCAFEIRKQFNPITFAWQSRFYDHIIRSDKSLNKIREYIETNPEMWERDRNNLENLFM